MRGLDDAALIDAVAGWARASPACDARKCAAIAECDNPACPAAVDDGRASIIVVHVITEQATTEAPRDPQLNGEGLVPAEAAEQATRRKAALIVEADRCLPRCWPNSSPAAPRSSPS